MKKGNTPLFYNENCDLNSIIYLTPDESKHAIKSLRLKKNDLVIVTNGKGYFFESKIKSSDYKQVELEIISKQEIKPIPYYLHIACAIPHQSERFEWFVEKAIELGISEITPIFTKRTEKKTINIERLYRIAISALKQSRQAHLTTINRVADYNNFILNVQQSNKGIAYCNGNRMTIKKWIEQSNTNKYVVIIGPEGDFTNDEIDMAIQNNFTLLYLGNSILRTETASVYVSSVFRMLKQQ